jgi:hypothetical protein
MIEGDPRPDDKILVLEGDNNLPASDSIEVDCGKGHDNESSEDGEGNLRMQLPLEPTSSGGASTERSSPRKRSTSRALRRGETSELAIDMFGIKGENLNALDPDDLAKEVSKTKHLARLSIFMLITLGVVAGIGNKSHFPICITIVSTHMD